MATTSQPSWPRPGTDGSDSSVRVVQGHIPEAESAASAVPGHDAAVVALGSIGPARQGHPTRNVVDDMTQHYVRRLVVVSAAGVGESWEQISWLERLLFRTLLRNIYADYETQEGGRQSERARLDDCSSRIRKDEPA